MRLKYNGVARAVASRKFRDVLGVSGRGEEWDWFLVSVYLFIYFFLRLDSMGKMRIVLENLF